VICYINQGVELGTPLFKTSRYEVKRVDDNQFTEFIQANIQQASVIIDFRRVHIVNFRGRASWKAALPLFARVAMREDMEISQSCLHEL
jgi:hypothetical protein